jgi:hypothetical protein
MPENKLLQPEKIHLLDFKLIKGQIDSPFDFIPDHVEYFDYNVDFKTSFNFNEKLVKTDFTIHTKTKSKEKVEEANSFYHFVYIFRVDNLDELALKDDAGTLKINSSLGNALASITYSTSRGVLMSRFQGTVFKDFILPVTDPNSLLFNQYQQTTAQK